MDQRIYKAACSGDINILHQLLQENPFILSDYTFINPEENLLTLAAKANQAVFVREILRLNPQLAAEVNRDGVRPLDVASAYGNVEIVRDILAAVGPTICRQPGRDRRTALHYAVMNGRCEIIDQLISACSDCVKDVTSLGETVLHLAVKYFKFEALKSLLQWIEKLDPVKEVMNWGDAEGNSVLHYAVLRKQLECVELLLDWNNKTRGNKLQLNSVNKKGLTAMDIVEILTDCSNDVQIREISRLIGRSGSISSDQIHIIQQPANTNNQRLLPPEKPKNWLDIIKLFQFQWHRDSPAEARASLLVVVTLIAAVTFEAGINPPSYLFEASNRTITATINGTKVNSNTTEMLNEIQRTSAERVTLVSITVFLVANSIALSTATSIIDYLMVGLPFQRELRVSTWAMLFAYSWSLLNTKPTGTVKTVLLIVAVCMPLFLRLGPYLIQMLGKLKQLQFTRTWFSEK